MQLIDYLKKHNVSASCFGDQIGVSRQTVWKYIMGKMFPRAEVLARIIKQTRGMVDAGDMLNTYKKSKKEKL